MACTADVSKNGTLDGLGNWGWTWRIFDVLGETITLESVVVEDAATGVAVVPSPLTVWLNFTVEACPPGCTPSGGLAPGSLPTSSTTYQLFLHFLAPQIALVAGSYCVAVTYRTGGGPAQTCRFPLNVSVPSALFTMITNPTSSNKEIYQLDLLNPSAGWTLVFDTADQDVDNFDVNQSYFIANTETDSSPQKILRWDRDGTNQQDITPASYGWGIIANCCNDFVSLYYTDAADTIRRINMGTGTVENSLTTASLLGFPSRVIIDQTRQGPGANGGNAGRVVIFFHLGSDQGPKWADLDLTDFKDISGGAGAFTPDYRNATPDVLNGWFFYRNDDGSTGTYETIIIEKYDPDDAPNGGWNTSVDIPYTGQVPVNVQALTHPAYYDGSTGILLGYCMNPADRHLYYSVLRNDTGARELWKKNVDSGLADDDERVMDDDTLGLPATATPGVYRIPYNSLSAS